MADQRMIHRSVICSDEFTELSFEAQALYMHLTLEADNFGFVSGVRKLMRSIGAKPDALEELIEARFALRFDTGVLVIRHWMISNGGFKADRTYSTNFPSELAMLCVLEDLTYGFRMEDNGFQMDSNGFQMEPQYNNNTWSRQYRAIHHINKALQEQGMWLSSSSSSQDARAREDTDGDDDNNDDTDPIVYTDKQTGEGMTLREYLATLPWAVGATWEMIQPFREQMDDSLIRFAIDQTASMGPDAPEQYLKTVLYDYVQAGFTTEEDARRHEKWRSEKLS